MKVVKINTDNISDRDSFHKEFKEVFGFPEFYGNNMSAWVDCMTDLDDSDSGMTSVTVAVGEILVIELENVESFKTRCKQLYDELIESVAFVNYRRIEQGQEPILTLSFNK